MTAGIAIIILCLASTHKTQAAAANDSEDEKTQAAAANDPEDGNTVAENPKIPD